MAVGSPVAAPIIGGMLTAPLFSLLVVPALYLAMARGRLLRAPHLGVFTD